MFKNIDKMPQRKLKVINFWSQLFYIVLSFVTPILIVLIECFNNGDIAEGYKLPLMMIILIASVLSASTKYLKKAVDKIKILNIDGTYNIPMRTFKNLSKGFGDIIMPLAVLIISIIFINFLPDAISFYLTMVEIIASCYIAGNIWNALICLTISAELDLRYKVATNNAVARRSDLV